MSGSSEIGPIVITAYKEQTYGMGGGGYNGTYSMQAQHQHWNTLLGFDPDNAPGGARWIGRARGVLGKQETAVKNNYIEAQKKLEDSLKEEVDALKESNPVVGNTPVEKLKFEIALYSALIDRKTTDFQEQVLISHAFYGGDPIGRSPIAFAKALGRLRRQGLTSPDGIGSARYKSLVAAYTAKLIESVIASLKAQVDTLNRSLAEAISRAAHELAAAKEQAMLKQYPVAPPGVSIDENLEAARRQDQFYSTSGSAYLYTWFYTKVRNRGDWDYKQGGPEYQNFGNFNYGAAGTAAGISEGVLLRGAGAAQILAGTSSAAFGEWWSEAPYGDDPIDQVWIKAGVDYAKSKGY